MKHRRFAGTLLAETLIPGSGSEAGPPPRASSHNAGGPVNFPASTRFSAFTQLQSVDTSVSSVRGPEAFDAVRAEDSRPLEMLSTSFLRVRIPSF